MTIESRTTAYMNKAKHLTQLMKSGVISRDRAQSKINQMQAELRSRNARQWVNNHVEVVVVS